MASRRGTRAGKFSRSLYVGTTTSGCTVIDRASVLPRWRREIPYSWSVYLAEAHWVVWLGPDGFQGCSRGIRLPATSERYAFSFASRTLSLHYKALCVQCLLTVMHRFLLLLGLGPALLAAGACDQGPDTPLTQAAARNDVAALRHLLEAGHKADEVGDSWTALIWAARSGSVDAINVLLDAGADVNLPGSTGDDWDATPLQHAILARQPAAVRLLLDRGADLTRGGGSLTPLFLAAGDTDPAILKLLLAHGADPSVEDKDGATPLFRAVSAGTLHGPDRPMFGGCRVETVRALITHDPSLRLKRNAAWNDAVWWARFQRCDEVLRLIGE